MYYRCRWSLITISCTNQPQWSLTLVDCKRRKIARWPTQPAEHVRMYKRIWLSVDDRLRCTSPMLLLESGIPLLFAPCTIMDTEIGLSLGRRWTCSRTAGQCMRKLLVSHKSKSENFMHKTKIGNDFMNHNRIKLKPRLIVREYYFRKN